MELRREPLRPIEAGRVEDWRASIRVRWVTQGFRHGPQSGSHRYVYSPRRLKPDVRISRIRLSDKDSCVRPRKVTGAHLQPGQTQRVIEIYVGVACPPLSR